MSNASDSVVIITSAEVGLRAFGTGFVIANQPEGSFVLTCAHVVRDVGIGQVRVAGLPAIVVSSGESSGIDLSVLFVEGLSLSALALLNAGRRGERVAIIGYARYGDYLTRQTLSADLANDFEIATLGTNRHAPAWRLTVAEGDTLQGGYSGAPLIETDSGAVIGVMITREEGTSNGAAIASAALPLIWPAMPSGLLRESATLAIDPTPVILLARPDQQTAQVLARLEQLNKELDLLAEKVGHLRYYLVLETDPSAKFKLKKQVEEDESYLRARDQELSQLKAEIDRLRPTTPLAPPPHTDPVQLAIESSAYTPELSLALRLRGVRAFPVKGRVEAGATPYLSAGALRGLSDEEAGREGLRAALDPLRPQLATNPALALELFTYQNIDQIAPAALSLDWRSSFPGNQPPPAEVWERDLMPALTDLREELWSAGVRRLEIHGRAVLSAGYALGYALQRQNGFTLAVAALSGAFWTTDSAGGEGERLHQEFIVVDPAASDVSVEISLTQDARLEIGQTISALNLPINRRVQLTSSPVLRADIDAAKAFVTSPAHARTLAGQITSAILSQKDIYALQPSATVHLFGPIPLALAIMVGSLLNTARPVQCYEYVKGAGGYQATCQLKP